ncbi:hypothetical protein BDV98DRAFT_62166 [Pterulicium gracile]|uniref:GRF-type domain-containing protein n=1 Tax=Pterulicium gracile TaxID=1884261 RepID=A0A5C3QHN2_9AGAR|nr:hypothetical protein BDV98DRAFT_62166 [Pterula gracilis]
MSQRTTTTVHTIPANPDPEDGVVKCLKHRVAAILLTSHTDKNPGRTFFKCAIDDPNKCSFFKWHDELNMNAPSSSAAAASSQRQSQSGAFASKPSSLVKIQPQTPTPTRSRLNSTSQPFLSSQDTAVGIPSKVLHYGSQESPSKKRRLSVGSMSDDDLFSSQPASSKLDFNGSQLSQSSPTKGVTKNNEASTQIANAIKEMSLFKEVVEKLERKLFASEQAQGRKAARIAELEREVQDWSRKCCTLEEENQQLRDSM